MAATPEKEGHPGEAGDPHQPMDNKETSAGVWKIFEVCLLASGIFHFEKNNKSHKYPTKDFVISGNNFFFL